MIAWFTKNGVAANLLMVSIVGLGLYTLSTGINFEVFPSTETETVRVTVPYRGSTPTESEEAVVIRIEEAIQDIAGIERIVSTAREGSGSVTVEIEDGFDPKIVLDDVKNRVDAINTFPAEVERPITSSPGRRDRVISINLSGDLTERELKELGTQVRDQLARVDGVSLVNLKGTRPYEIAIEISESTLRRYGITLAQVANKIRLSSIDLSAGSIRTEGGEVLLRTEGQAYVQEDFENIVVFSNPDGSRVLLSDIAQINDGFDEAPFVTTFNGKRAVMIDVIRVGDQDALEITRTVREFIEKISPTLPQGVSLTVWQDRSEIVKDRLNLLLRNAAQGGFLVLITLSLFLRPSLAFWVAIGIPVSFTGALILMPFLGVTINIITLFAFILVLGIVVDDAIVTGENVFSRMQRGEDSLTAAIEGTKEVSIPVTFGVITTMLAFTPLMMIDGRRGEIFANIPLIVIPVLFFSLIESKLILPCHLSHLKSIGRGKNREELGFILRFQRKFADGLEHFVKRFYQPVLHFCLRNRYATAAGFTVLFFIVLGVLSGQHMRFIFFPRVENDTVTARLTMPAGTHESITEMNLAIIEKAAIELKTEINEKYGEGVARHLLVTMGGHPFGGGFFSSGDTAGNRALAEVVMDLAPAEARPDEVGSGYVARLWRQKVGFLPGVDELSFNFARGGGGAVIDVELNGPSFAELSAVSAKIQERLQTYPGLFDIADSFESGKSELQISLKPAAEDLGITVDSIARQVRQSFFGAEAQRIQRGRDDIRVMVRYPEEERRSLVDLESMYVRTPSGQEIPFANVAEAKMGTSLTTIRRIDRNRTISVTADADFEVADVEAIRRDLETYVLPEILSDYPLVAASMEGEAREQQQSLSSLFYGIIIVLSGIYVILAVVFKSYLQPLIVFVAIPFGFVGAILGHYIMGVYDIFTGTTMWQYTSFESLFGLTRPLTILSIWGILALSGVVVNDSLVLVDYINQKRLAGNSLLRAIARSGAARFRPILLTSLTTFAGLFPLFFEKSRQAQFLIPMAVSMGWGIIFATFVTLLLVPCTYLILDDMGRIFRRGWSWYMGRETPSLPERGIALTPTVDARQSNEAKA